MHPRNPYATRRPDFAALARNDRRLAPFLTTVSTPSIDFSDTAALRALTTALLKVDFSLDVELRDDRLCPTIANRLDYILTCLDLPTSEPLRVLDVGTGHVAIYALLLHRLRPNAAIYGSELDPASLEHAREMLKANGIPTVPSNGGSGITLLPGCADNVSLLSHAVYPLSFTMCNPPFFSSPAEAAAAREGKANLPPAGPTCAEHEEVTRGGEAAFIGQMVDESVSHSEECEWFTSLVGRYASLEELVARVRGVTRNYAVIRLQQAVTARWVLAWSFGAHRLPDEMTRPRHLDPSTSFARLLPPSNTFNFRTTLPEDELVAVVRRVLDSVGLGDTETGSVQTADILNAEGKLSVNGGEGPSVEKADIVDTKDTEGESTEQPEDPERNPCERVIVELAPMMNSWSRSARRAGRKLNEGDTDPAPDATADGSAAPWLSAASDLPVEPAPVPNPLFRATLATRSTDAGAGLVMHWRWGPDRSVVDGFWKFVVTKSGLKGQPEGTATGRGKRGREDGERGEIENAGASREGADMGEPRLKWSPGHSRNHFRGRDGGRGGRGRGRGRGWGQDAGWGRRGA